MIPHITISIVRPDAKPPLLAAYEVSVEVGDPQIIDRFRFAGVVHLLDGHPLAVVARQQIAGLQLGRRHPTLVE